MSLFKNKDGTLRWSVYWGGLLIFLVLVVILSGFDLSTAFGKHFMRAGIFVIIGPILSAFAFAKVKKKYDAQQTIKPREFAYPLFFMVICILGPLVAIKANQASGIPDEAGLYNNGKVINCCNPDEDHYYFDIYAVNSVDSLYIVTYGEEPGYSYHPYAEPSTAPRRDEFSWKHITKDALRLKGKY